MVSDIALCAALALIGITSVLSNFLVVGCIAKTPSLQNSANLLLCSLSLNDLLGSVSTVPLLVFNRLLSRGHIGPISVCTFQVLKTICTLCLRAFTTGSFLLLCVLSWDRYRAISDPLLYRAAASKAKTLKTTAALWVAWIVLALSFDVFGHVRRIISAVRGFAVLAVLVSLQVATYVALRRRNREIVANSDSQVTITAVLAREKRVVTTLRYVMAASLLSLAGPLIVYTWALSTRGEYSFQSEMLAWGYVCVLMNSCVNPLIYFLRHPAMLTAALRLLGYQAASWIWKADKQPRSWFLIPHCELSDCFLALFRYNMAPSLFEFVHGACPRTSGEVEFLK